MDQNWLCWLYQYGVGGIVFFLSIFIAVKSNALPNNPKAKKRIINSLVLGYFYFLSVHAIWIYSVVGLPLGSN